ncbi:uncharacterized protein LOC108682421 isoform X2 [Hyalella azteca]|uniref:Uncharacterized protein LOC108682421 isoform X2 n=1 Tax=Hyalella azteca TaxID=294128 RepID=A0A8B7PNR5_HYAAZ|nr:uncharacterized protein LOC108682421 isoform X2 [Hyalella azteca]
MMNCIFCLRKFTVTCFLIYCVITNSSVSKCDATIQSSYDAKVGVSREVMAGRQLYVYKAYKDMHIFHFSVPPLTSNVTFIFTANDTEACSPRNVSMYITQGSYPVVAVNGEEFPANLWVDRGVKVYPVELSSNSVPVSLTIISPVPGSWFMAGAVTEDSNRITQAGLVPSCQSWVRVEAEYHQDVVVTNVMPTVVGEALQPPIPGDITHDTYYRFYVGPYGFSASVFISKCSAYLGPESEQLRADGSCPLMVELTPLALSHHSSNHSVVVNCTESAELLVNKLSNDEAALNFTLQDDESKLNSNLQRSDDTALNSTLYGDEAAINSSLYYDDPVVNFELLDDDDDENKTTTCEVPGVVMEDAWHYVRIVPLAPRVTYELSVALTVCGRCHPDNQLNPSSASDPLLQTVSHLFNVSFSDLNDTVSSAVDRNYTDYAEISNIIKHADNNSAVDSIIANRAEKISQSSGRQMQTLLEAMNNPSSNSTNYIIHEVDKNNVTTEQLLSLAFDSGNLTLQREVEYLNEVDSNLADDLVLLYDNTSRLNSTFTENITYSESDGNNNVSDLNKSPEGCWNRHDLVRKSFSDNLVFEYDLSPNINGSVPLMVNVSTTTPTLLVFSLTPFLDLGGTLSVELALYPFLNTSSHQYRLSGCLTSGLREMPQHYTPCSRGYTFHLNTSSGGSGGSLDNVAKSVFVPYPDPGPWYLSLTTACYVHKNTTVASKGDIFSNTNSSTNESNNFTALSHGATNTSDGTTNTSDGATSTSDGTTSPTHSTASMVSEVPCSSPEVTTIFSVSSSACIQGKCGRYGACYQYVYSGFIFSTCVCEAGYKGWTCSDASDATPDGLLLLATLLLTLSNLAFVPAVLLAIYRHHYTEGLVYCFTMCFSTFYHACDQQVYSWCIMRASVLQFCDFYSAILAFWVTLIAMAELPFTLYSVLHMTGAIMVAMGVEYDRTGLWVFAVPAISAFIVMAVSWGMHTRRGGTCYPPTRYWLCCLLPGTLLAATGLICYAFLETHDNYQYVHSAWHVTMALSILCLLPPRRPCHAGDKLLVSDGSDSADQVLNGSLVL